MESIANLALAIKPTRIDAYPDTLRVWLRTPLSSDQFRWLQLQCGKLQPFHHASRFDLRYRFRLDIQQPSYEAVKFLNQQSDAVLTRTDEALDFVFDIAAKRQQAYELIDRHLYKRYHRRQHGIRYCGGTRYTAPHKIKTKVVMYDSKESRISGEVECLHVEYRMFGQAALRRHGIDSLADILGLNRRQFWNQHLLLYGLDVEVLARRLHRPVTSIREMVEMNTVQDIVDGNRHKGRVRDALIRIDNGQLLPSESRGWNPCFQVRNSDVVGFNDSNRLGADSVTIAPFITRRTLL
jgi:hypothetical protein